MAAAVIATREKKRQQKKTLRRRGPKPPRDVLGTLQRHLGVATLGEGQGVLPQCMDATRRGVGNPGEPFCHNRREGGRSLSIGISAAVQAGVGGYGLGVQCDIHHRHELLILLAPSFGLSSRADGAG